MEIRFLPRLLATTSKQMVVYKTMALILAFGLLNGCQITNDPVLDPDRDDISWPDDCDSSDSKIYPGASEVCDGVDQDCDGYVDEGLPLLDGWYLDQDGDNYGDPSVEITDCKPPDNAVSNDLDCNDGNAEFYPGAADRVDGDGTDQNCDGIDGVDQDGDGCASVESGGVDCNDDNPESCSLTGELDDDCDYDGMTELEGDCNDADSLSYLEAEEICDDVDQNCDGQLNEDWEDNFEPNNSSSTAYNLGEIDYGPFWAGDDLEIIGLSFHNENDNDWFYFDVDDEYYDNADFVVTFESLDVTSTWVIELYNNSLSLESFDSGKGTLQVSFSGDTFDDSEDDWYIRIYPTLWLGGTTCETTYSLEIDA